MFWLAVAGPDAERAAQHLAEQERARMSPEERDAADSIIDLDAEQNACPACGGTIPQARQRCPECGLRIG